MPAFYAHYRFGKLALPELPPDVRQSIQRFRRLYDMGLQGPDFFFYHNPFFQTASRDLGSKFHYETGETFFTRACGQVNSEAARVYLWGVLGHYCLDSVSHPFVNKMEAEGLAVHSPLESEFERYLLEMDGNLPVHTQNFHKRIKLTRGECVTVAGFYPPASPGSVHQAIRFMGLYSRFLNQKNRTKVENLLRFVKPSLQEYLIPLEPDPVYLRMDSELLARFNRALKAYPQMLHQLTALMQEGTPLGEEFDPVFG